LAPVLPSDESAIKQEISKVQADNNSQAKILAGLSKSVVSVKGKAFLQSLMDTQSIYAGHERSYLGLVAAGDKTAAKDLLLNSLAPSQKTRPASWRNW
jgi:hypothetical protein